MPDSVFSGTQNLIKIHYVMAYFTVVQGFYMLYCLETFALKMHHAIMKRRFPVSSFASASRPLSDASFEIGTL